ncbi:hypothetical protein EDD66_10461 [Mobilisporobacter senegalensis]|uniref:Uncharacterized protein n=1 Tax=Mobilisporobacter senegalensis TaxID=1329262 RepID=A0A3N1XP73_9FIRM|nr:hypothetical protein [Mobilisporobacter senegalensis]ROR28479.1 hypothetical protein EDD66_10461 [Mobilisporobacter senegalensis]
MKKTLTALLIIVLGIMMAGCSIKDKPVSNENVEEKVTETVEDTTQDETASNEEESPSEKSTSNGSLSDDLYSFQVELNGHIYQFPMSYSDLTSNGWKYEGDTSLKLEPDQYTTEQFSNEDGLKLYVDIVNLGINSESFDNCQIGGFSIDNYAVGDKEISLILPGGIQYGKSTMEDVIKAYGDPSDTYEGSLYTSLTYEYASYQDIDLNIDIETKVINSIDLRNFVLTEEAAGQNTEVSSEVPSVVSEYKAPSSLGNDLTSFIVDYDGALYQLPAPVSEFVKNGWKVKPEESDPAVKAKDSGWITLMKNNQSLRVIVRNYAEAATTIDNCFVTTVKGGDNSTDMPITIQHKITRGMSKSDLEKALKGTKYETDDSSSFEYYTIAGKESSLDKVEIIVNKDTKKIQSIEVSNSPRR